MYLCLSICLSTVLSHLCDDGDTSHNSITPNENNTDIYRSDYEISIKRDGEDLRRPGNTSTFSRGK